MGSIYAQENKVGINTTTPIVTLNVDDVKDNAHPAGLQAPRLTRAELTTLGDAAYTADHKGTLIYITDVQGGDTQGQRILVTDPGYYYFDGAKWERAVSTGEYRNLYIKNGTLAGNRIVTQDEKTLTFDKTTGLTVFENTTNPPMQVIDGEQGKGMVLSSDVEGNAQWEVAAVPRVEGQFFDRPENAVNAPSKRFNTNMYIDLPAGKWALHIGSEIKFLDNPTSNGIYWATVSVGTADVLSGANADTSMLPTSGAGTVMNTGILAAAGLDAKFGKNNLQGAAIVTVRPPAGQETQRLYFYIGVFNRWGATAVSSTNRLGNYFKKDSPNTYLYAMRLVD